ncbi:MAG: hypothetical protein C0508_18175 [Cyanobacteria bacterium PR.023]|nr:hypothetical protein [Cyanobacteria bacterium PR.023]
MRLSQETKRQQDLFGSTIIDSVKRHHLGAEPLMGMLQETKRQADLFGIVGEPGLFKVTSLDSEVIKLSRIADATNKQAMRLGGQLGKFTDPFNTGNTDDPFGLSALVQKELDKEKEFARKELEEQQRRKECSYGRYEQFLCSARDLADKVHFKLSKVEKYSLTTSEFQDRWLTQLREWHCEIQDCLDIFWFDTPVIYYTQISERYTRTWRQLTMMSTKLLEIEVDIDHLLKAAS